MIEKHFTLARADGGVGLGVLARARRVLRPRQGDRATPGSRSARCTSAAPSPEQAGRRKRRSLYIAEDLRAGDRLTETSLRRVRPGLGLPPKYYETLLGRTLAKDAPRGTPVTWDLLL